MSARGLMEDRDIAGFRAILDSLGTAPDPESLPRAKLPLWANQGDRTTPLSCSKLVELHLALLDMEREAQITRFKKQEEFGKLKRLLVAGTERTPHGGLRLWVLRRPGDAGQLLPKHNIRAREPVEVTREDSQVFDVNQRAVVYRVTDYEMTLVMNDGEKLILDKVMEVRRVDDDQMHSRMKKVLIGLSTLLGPPNRLREILFAERPMDMAIELPLQLTNEDGELQLFNDRLDSSQREAVEFALRQKRLAVIHGPPGTGKTTTVVEVMLQHLKLGQRVLACAHSNMAVDNLLERLAEAKVEDMVRFGHPARIRDKLLRFALKTLLKERSASQGSGGEEELRRRIIKESRMVFCTLALTSENGYLEEPEDAGAFDLVVIDECSQSVEAACWLAAQRSGKLLLAGDHCQLPPTILSEPAARYGLAISLMERQVKLHGEAAVRMLCTQYRMHELIQQWPSEQLYSGRLEAAPAVRHHRLPQLDGVRETANTEPTLLLIDTAGCRLTESAPDETGSRRNDGEADLVTAHVAALVRDGVPQSQIGVIAPYKAQMSCVRAGLRRRRVGDVEVHSVDGFQGREKEVVLVSQVRSGVNCSLKFVGNRRRVNVAVTRARRQLVIVCDTETMCRDESMRSLIEHMRQHGEVRSARSYANELREALRHRVPCSSPSTEEIQEQAAEASAPKDVCDESSGASNVSSLSQATPSPSNSNDKASQNGQIVSEVVPAADTTAVHLTPDQCLAANAEADGGNATDKQVETPPVESTGGAEEMPVMAKSVVSVCTGNMTEAAATITADTTAADSSAADSAATDSAAADSAAADTGSAAVDLAAAGSAAARSPTVESDAANSAAADFAAADTAAANSAAAGPAASNSAAADPVAAGLAAADLDVADRDNDAGNSNSEISSLDRMMADLNAAFWW